MTFPEVQATIWIRLVNKNRNTDQRVHVLPYDILWPSSALLDWFFRTKVSDIWVG